MVRQETEDGLYKLIVPEGGWGYLITASLIVLNLVSTVPLSAFGILYGQFLASIGDETTGTTLTNGIFNTVQSFTGLATSVLLRKYSYRKIGCVGAIIFSLGGFGTIFVQNLTQLIITFGVLQGLGFGLMFPSVLSAINSYFELRLNLMMGLAQTIITIGTILCPPTVAFLYQSLGFRNTLIVMAGSTLLSWPAMGVLHPVKWHMKKVPIGISKVAGDGPMLDKPSSSPDKVLEDYIEPLLDTKMDTPNKKIDAEQKKVKILDFSLLKDPKYLNISLGLSLSLTADIAFVSVIRIVLNNLNFQVSEITQILMVHFTSDLVSRICFSVVSYFFSIKNRYLFLAGSILSAIFRIAFVLRDDYTWKMVNMGVLGFLRCFIQTPLPMVISDEYKDNFSTAFSLFMVVAGVVSLIFGPLMSYVRATTQSDVLVIHVLTAAYLICSISWIIELLYSKMKKNNRTINVEKL